MTAITAKVRCSSRLTDTSKEYDVVSFAPNYEDGANSEWSYYTPALSLQMNVRKEVPFKPGTEYTLTFTEDE